MIHSGSRGLGHQVATDALVEMERAMGRDDILPNDRLGLGLGSGSGLGSGGDGEGDGA